MINEKYFETIKCLDREPLHLVYHQKRIARTVGLNIDLDKYIYPPNQELLRCKVLYDYSGILDVSFYPYIKKSVDTFSLIFDNNIEYASKKVDRSDINNLFNKKDKEDEIIIVKNGFITDTSIANIAVDINGIWFTAKEPLLPGTTRERLLSDGTIKAKDIDIHMLKNASKIALMNAMIGFDIKDDFRVYLPKRYNTLSLFSTLYIH